MPRDARPNRTQFAHRAFARAPSARSPNGRTSTADTQPRDPRCENSECVCTYPSMTPGRSPRCLDPRKTCNRRTERRFPCRVANRCPSRSKTDARRPSGGYLAAELMVRTRFPPAASQVRTCLSREFAFLGREAAVFRGCAGRSERRGRQRCAGRGNIGPTGGIVATPSRSALAP